MVFRDLHAVCNLKRHHRSMKGREDSLLKLLVCFEVLDPQSLFTSLGYADWPSVGLVQVCVAKPISDVLRPCLSIVLTCRLD